MAQAKGACVHAVGSGVPFEIDGLTQTQRITLSRITTNFRENAVVQTLVGPNQVGKSLLGDFVAQCLAEKNKAVFITRDGDLAPAYQKLMQEAYGSYYHLLAGILKQLGFYARGSEEDLVEQLVEQVRNLRNEGKRILLVIDDAQDLTPGVWKRLHSWLDFQDRGVRMFQVMLIGTPLLKRILSEPLLRSWRRWTHGHFELRPLKGRKAFEEARELVQRTVNQIKESHAGESIPTPIFSYFALRRVVKESGGFPGQLQVLVEQAVLNALKNGQHTISLAMLKKMERVPTAQSQRPVTSQRLEKTAHPLASEEDASTTAKVSGGLPVLRLAMSFLLVLFLLGAGWGVYQWVSQAPNQLTNRQTAQVEDSEPVAPAISVEDPFQLDSVPVVETADTGFDPFAMPIAQELDNQSATNTFQLAGGVNSGTETWNDFPPLPPLSPLPEFDDQQTSLAMGDPVSESGSVLDIQTSNTVASAPSVSEPKGFPNLADDDFLTSQPEKQAPAETAVVSEPDQKIAKSSETSDQKPQLNSRAWEALNRLEKTLRD